ncbi:MAG: aminotransferase class V-fold PLP-dependent enzyme [Saprospiraceae bacterium]|nr:aminotransferase class V-fold PLP-dependent enzyme [bacterium]MDB4414815.1 aminotransferase class V-fold PLP-dependent enzyme [bacterium]MDC3209901.1 aminotransferase class V-fold PLP-dependent enzyme [Saprospiraceae bacterium]MDG1434437.1 aminotransferase class V-fold PLP-dependent enzyme [Saprospiraceae bacterium]MDG2419294.1 aminotransferase class V-fold PLP-dependent enzyme [Saprospiraceae bacterium]
MNDNRRKFLQKLSGAAGALTFAPFINPILSKSVCTKINKYKEWSAEDLASNEEFWYQVRQAYTVSTNIVNLNNGGVSPSPKVVQDAVERYNRLSNEAPSYYMWRVLDRGKEGLRGKLADLAGVSMEEIAINRNASEALETVIFGLRLKRGDEVVLSKQDYPNVINAWKQRSLREGIVLNFISFDFPIENKKEIVQKFKNAFTAKTKVVNITHMINWVGQILPVNEIAAEARKKNIEVVVDGAHTFGHLDFKVSDLDCDYFGTSLHKWLCAPFGSGMLYVKKDKIKNLFPLFAGEEPEGENIKKFESLGTRSFAIEQAIGQAIDFHHWIGGDRKQKRLHYLKNYWMEKVKNLPRVKIHTSLKPEFGCAIGLFSIDGKTPGEISNFLFRDFQIHTVGINWENIHGVRVAPNVYSTVKDLDRLVLGVKDLIKNN